MECFEDRRLVRVCDVASQIGALLAVLDKESGNFAMAKAAMGESLYNGFVNSLCVSLFSMLSSMLMGREEKLAYAKRVAESCPACASAKVVEIEGGEGDPSGGSPKA